jgi:hypothetical protein
MSRSRVRPAAVAAATAVLAAGTTKGTGRHRRPLPGASPDSAAAPSGRPAARLAGGASLAAADYCVAVVAGLSVLLVVSVHYLLTQPYWLDEAWVADSVRAPLGQAPRLSSSTPLGWTLLLRLVPFGGPQRQRLVPLAFDGLAVACGYLLGRELRLSRFSTGLLTAAGVLLAPAMLARGDLKQYTAEAFSAVLLWFLVARLENRWTRPRLAALGLVASAGTLIAATAILTGAAALGCLALECAVRRQWRRLTELAVTAAGTLAVFAVVYAVVLRPRINPALSGIWRFDYLPGADKSPLSFLRLQLRNLAPYLGLPGHDGAVATVALAAAGVIALAALGRFALAALLPATVTVVIAASAARIYPFGDERTSTFWLVMIPVLMAIAAATAISAVGRVPPGRPSPPSPGGQRRARRVAALALTAAALAGWAHAASPRVRVQTIPAQSPYAEIRYVEGRLRPGDVILVNSEAAYAFAYYYQHATDDYMPSATVANGFIPQYPVPGIIVATGRDQQSVTSAVRQANAVIAAEQPGHRGRVWVIRDHLTPQEARYWRTALAGAAITTITFPPLNRDRQEPLLAYQPAAPHSSPGRRATSAGAVSCWRRLL